MSSPSDRVLGTPPTNTPTGTPTTMPPGSPAESAGALYYPTPVTPEEAFQAIGRLRKEARDEIERLIRFLDDTDDHMEREPDGDEEDASYAEGHSQLCAHNEDGADDEPSLRSSGHGAAGPISYSVPAISDGCEMVYDCEGDEHDGREPDGGDDEPSASFDTGEPSLGWTVDGCTSAGTGQGRWDIQHDLEVSP
jgi:hypothetical protein